MQFVYALILMIASYVVTSLLTPKPQTPAPASQRDFQFPQFQEGTVQTVVFGECWTGDWMVVWFGDLASEPITKSSKK